MITPKNILSKLLLLSVLCAIFSACTLTPQQVTKEEDLLVEEEYSEGDNTIAPEAKIEITFKVEIPLEKQSQVYLDILDEVTGLALNSKRFPMNRIDETHFEVNIPFKPGTVLKYRYAREGNPIAIEHTPLGAQVRYRFYYINNPAEVEDRVAAWNDVTYVGEIGRIQGKVTDISNNPIPDILISAAGVNTISTSDGSFLLEGLPPGTHNLVAYSLDGRYISFQQQALIAANATTPAPLQMPPTHNVNITFVLTLPEDNTPGLPIRILGNIYSLGNTFSNLAGGMSILASRAPYLSSLPDGRYSITLSLPAGLDLRYKYSLGDGFWNTEHKSDGSFRVRQLIVPESDQIIEDQIDGWLVGEYKPIMFQVDVPEDTPKSDIVSIQFNPYAWTEPIPMWPAGENRWVFILNSPLHLLNNIQYRYCRNEQCGIADPAGVVGSLNQAVINTANAPEMITDEVLQWAWTQMEQGQTKIVGREVKPRSLDFVAGVQLLDYYHPSWSSYTSQAFRNIKDIGANWIYLTPTWHFTSTNPPVLEVVPGKDTLWTDLEKMVVDGKNSGVKIALFPQTKFEEQEDLSWWTEAHKEAGWWQSWFDRYRTFLLNFADFAQQNQVEAIVLGEPGLLPSLPNGYLSDGTPSNVFLDSEERWQEIIKEIRARYDGQLILALNDATIERFPPSIITEVDAHYITLTTAINEDEEAFSNGLETAIGSLLDNKVKPLWDTFQKPIIIGLKYPSTQDALNGCIQTIGACLPFEVLDQPMEIPINVTLNLDIQLDIYEAAMSTVNEREWINGVVSRGYFPPAELQDLSISIHGKPASAVLWYWYPRFLSNQQ